MNFFLRLFFIVYFKNLGTMGWRAKEVIENLERTKSTDIFSLGCIFYFI